VEFLIHGKFVLTGEGIGGREREGSRERGERIKEIKWCNESVHACNVFHNVVYACVHVQCAWMYALLLLFKGNPGNLVKVGNLCL
jgi:hypothetical protein